MNKIVEKEIDRAIQNYHQRNISVILIRISFALEFLLFIAVGCVVGALTYALGISWLWGIPINIVALISYSIFIENRVNSYIVEFTRWEESLN